MNVFYLNAEPELRAQQHVVDGGAVCSRIAIIIQVPKAIYLPGKTDLSRTG